MIVNKRELSEIIGVSERTLSEWQKQGLPVASYASNRGQSNEYSTTDIIAWLVNREIAKIQQETPKDRLDRVKADKIELEIKEKTGELAPVAMFERAWHDHILAARTEFLTMPEILATELSAITGADIDPEIIKTHIDRALEKLSQYGAENENHAEFADTDE